MCLPTRALWKGMSQCLMHSTYIPRDISFLHPKGIERISTTNRTIYLKQTLPGLKLMIVVQPHFPAKAAQDILSVIYSNYADYVLKDPFYSIDMPVRCSLFDRAVRQILAISST